MQRPDEGVGTSKMTSTTVASLSFSPYSYVTNLADSQRLPYGFITAIAMATKSVTRGKRLNKSCVPKPRNITHVLSYALLTSGCSRLDVLLHILVGLIRETDDV